MDYSYIFHSAKPIYERFSAFGFEKDTDGFILRKNLSIPDFKVLVKIQGETLTAQVYDFSSLPEGERYTLFDVKNANGAFVSKIREEVQSIIEDFRSECFSSTDIHKKYKDYIEKEFECKAEYPWGPPKDESEKPSVVKSERFADYAVFRASNQKWFAIIMHITYKQLGFENDEKVFVVNLKYDSDKVTDIIDKKSVFPAYHMNKKHWITVLLTDVTDFEKLQELTKRSYELVNAG